MSVTKSIRLEPDELLKIQSVVELMPGASEAAALKHLLLLGLDIQRKDAIVLLYTRDGLTTGEIAERLGMSRVEVLSVLEERQIKVFDPPVELFDQALRRDDLPGSAGPERP